jgi:1,4-alpha-glucan branching enzyme
VVRESYRIGLPQGGSWRELFCSDAAEFHGSGVQNPGKLTAEAKPMHGRPNSLTITLPPLAVALFAPG